MSTPRRLSLKGCKTMAEAEQIIRLFVVSVAIERAVPAHMRDQWIKDATREIVRELVRVFEGESHGR